MATIAEMTIGTAGRQLIETDVKIKNKDDVIKVLQDTFNDHLKNVERMVYLINYEHGEQPLQREKKQREEIDIKAIDNIANEINDFKISYQWSMPILYKQRGDIDIAKNDSNADDNGIAQINEMLQSENSFAEDLKLAYYVECCGLGYQFVDVKRDWEDGKSLFDLLTLSPLCTYIVHDNSIYHRPVLGVTYRRLKNGTTYYTCWTNDTRYEIRNLVEEVNGQKTETWSETSRNNEKNPLGKIPIVEFVHASDRMGAWERQIPDMDNLNILSSDYTNQVAQNTQAIWWGNDITFPEDENGNIKTPKSGGWILTYSDDTGKSNSVDIKPLVIETDYNGQLQNLQYRREIIKQKCSVPNQQSLGGGSTGTAMSMSSGWQNAEIAAANEEQYTRASKRKIAELILRAIKISPDLQDKKSPLLTLKLSDIDVSILRNRSYDLITKANAYATFVSHGVSGRHALELIEAFPDSTQVYLDSKSLIDAYQKSLTESKDTGEGRTMADLSDQISNSPFANSSKTGDSQKAVNKTQDDKQPDSNRTAEK